MKELLIRLIPSDDHEQSRDKLVEIIKKTGTDKYDSSRKHIFYDYYGKHNLDFFAEYGVNQENLEDKLKIMVEKFPKRTKGDRNKSVRPDIAIIYDDSRCKMIKNVYDFHEKSDCFRFKGNPKDALVEVRVL